MPVSQSEHKSPTSVCSGKQDNAKLSSLADLSSLTRVDGLGEKLVIVYDATQNSSSNYFDEVWSLQKIVTLSLKP